MSQQLSPFSRLTVGLSFIYTQRFHSQPAIQIWKQNKKTKTKKSHGYFKILCRYLKKTLIILFFLEIALAICL